jgi:hypothetical protein
MPMGEEKLAWSETCVPGARVDAGALSRRLLPNPAQLFRLYEAGSLTRAQWQAAMAWHASQILEEVAEARRHPVGAFIEDRLARRAAKRLARGHGEAELREVFEALAEVSDFPPAHRLWNAGHRDVPLHCFLRMRTEPVFRVLRFEGNRETVSIVVEHGRAAKKEAMREEFLLVRDRWARLVVKGRTRI